jgi:hypothetical protein
MIASVKRLDEQERAKTIRLLCEEICIRPIAKLTVADKTTVTLKRTENAAHAMSLHLFNYNFVSTHTTISTSPAMAAGVRDYLWEGADVITIV